MDQTTKKSVIGPGYKALVLLLALSAFFLCDKASAASLSLSSTSTTYTVDQTFSVVIGVQSPSESINAISGIVSFPADRLQISSLSKYNSIIGLWTEEPSFSNADGTANFEGLILNPGYQGAYGRVLTLVFKVKATGNATVSFSSASVLANDGQGSNILTGSSGVTLTLSTDGVPSVKPTPTTPPKPAANSSEISSKTHPDQSSWYNSPTFQASWILPIGTDAVRYEILPEVANPSILRGLVRSAQEDLATLKDGVWYFALRFHVSSGWGNTITRKIKIDRQPPETFEADRRDQNIYNPQPVIVFTTTDSLSGIAGYQMKIGSGDWFDPAPLSIGDWAYRLPLQAPGSRDIIVRAIDRAGNTRDSTLTLSVSPIDSPRVLHFSQQLDSHQQFFADGTGSPNSKLRLILKSLSNSFTLETPTDQEGKWTATFTDPLPGGNYDLIAQTIDSLGAQSNEVKHGTVVVRSWNGEAIGSIGEYTLLALLAILALALVATAAMFVWSRLQILRSRLMGKLANFESKIDHDAVQFEHDSKEGAPVMNDLENIREDISKEIQDLKDI